MEVDKEGTAAVWNRIKKSDDEKPQEQQEEEQEENWQKYLISIEGEGKGGRLYLDVPLGCHFTMEDYSSRQGNR